MERASAVPALRIGRIRASPRTPGSSHRPRSPPSPAMARGLRPSAARPWLAHELWIDRGRRAVGAAAVAQPRAAPGPCKRATDGGDGFEPGLQKSCSRSAWAVSLFRACIAPQSGGSWDQHRAEFGRRIPPPRLECSLAFPRRCRYFRESLRHLSCIRTDVRDGISLSLETLRRCGRDPTDALPPRCSPSTLSRSKGAAEAPPTECRAGPISNWAKLAHAREHGPRNVEQWQDLPQKWAALILHSHDSFGALPPEPLFPSKRTAETPRIGSPRVCSQGPL